MHKKHQLHSFVSFGSLLMALGTLFAASPALAGFQWIPPEQQAGASAKPSVEVSSPQAMELPPIAGMEGPVVITGKPSAPKPAPAAAPATAPVEDKAVQGFADNIPLTVALRQVLPPEVGFSVSPDVGVDTMVSWKGGASWRKVMKDMLEPAGLAYKEQGSLVSISRVGLGRVSMPEKAPAAVVAKVEPAPVLSSPSLPPPSDKPMALVPAAKAEKGAVSMPLEDRSSPSGRSGLLVAPTSDVRPVADVPATPSVAVSQPGMVDTWVAEKGLTLQKVLDSWCQRAGVEMNWQAEYDFPLQATVSFSNTFEEAVRALLGGFQEAKPQPVGYLYNNQVAGQTVLLIQVRGNNYNE